MDAALRNMLRAIQAYEPATPEYFPRETRDLLKRLYQYLVPKSLRHDLGEYYTPDWLAELVLDEVEYDGDPAARVLDPGCGSGTFLVLAIRRVRDRMEGDLLAPEETLKGILSNIVGFDLNPLAVIAARANYLLALGDLINYREGPLNIPVYLCDSILTPSREEPKDRALSPGVRVPTVVGDFDIPQPVVQQGSLEDLTACLETCVRDEYSVDEFLASVQSRLGLDDETFSDCEWLLRSLFKKLAGLEDAGRNRIWARLIKNAFAPLFQGSFDYVVGNPPWVNWESLRADYRDATKQLWVDYGLFSLSHAEGRLGGGKKDLSMLFVYACPDSYLKPAGRLSFLVTQTLFKSKGAGDGFRRFRLGDDEPLQVLRVHDMARMKPFPGVGNRTALFNCVYDGGEPTTYPVEYVLWEKNSGRTIDAEKSLDEVKRETRQHRLAASPINRDNSTSPWLTAAREAIPGLRKVIGQSDYVAHAGFYSGGLNGAYWVKVLRDLPDGNLLIRNMADVGRKDVEEVEAAVEPGLVYPLLRGRDISRWYAEPQCHALVPQDPETRVGWPVETMQSRWPKAYSYLMRFQDQLRRRAAYRKYHSDDAPFYSVYNVGPYTFSEWKVVWREVASGMTAAVVGPAEDPALGDTVVIPEHTAVLVSTNSRQEAHYLCAALNSAPVRLLVASYLHLHASPHVMEHVKIGQYDPSEQVHANFVQASMDAHSEMRLDTNEKAPAPDSKRLRDIQARVDRAAACCWGLTKTELTGIQETLAELE